MIDVGDDGEIAGQLGGHAEKGIKARDQQCRPRRIRSTVNLRDTGQKASGHGILPWVA